VALADIETLVRDLVRDQGGILDDTAVADAIQAAVAAHNAVRPRVVTADLAVAVPPGLPARLPLPPDWVAGVSRVRRAEHPIDREPPACLDPPYETTDSGGAHLRLSGAGHAGATPAGPAPGGVYTGATPAGPAPGAVVRITYTAPHILDAETDTLPMADRRPVAALAAAGLCDQLAAYFAGTQDSALGVEVADHGSRSGDWARRANQYRRQHQQAVGRHGGPASAVGTLGGLPRLRGAHFRGRSR